MEDFMVVEDVTVDAERIIDFRRVGLGAQFFEEDGYDAIAALNDEVRNWLAQNARGKFGGIGSRGAGSVMMFFEDADDAAKFEKRFG